MKGQELKILFRDDLAFLTNEVALSFQQVQLPDAMVRFKAAAFWKVRVINHIENEHRLFVQILSYHVGEAEFSSEQIQLEDLLNSIDIVTFKSIDTNGLLQTLYCEKPLTIFHPGPEKVYREKNTGSFQTKIQPVFGFALSSSSIDHGSLAPIKQTYNEPFSIPIKDVRFLDGKVLFEKRIERFKKLVAFEIFNEYIIKEYDAIKNYFASVLKTKKIHVIPAITMIDGVITLIQATSPEIEKIDKTLIVEVKFELVRNARKKEASEDKQLFTMNEWIEIFSGEDIKAQQIFKDDKDLFETLLERSESQHYKQLRFLSSKHQAEIQKLRVVHKPFSFVFLLRGMNNFYIVWETLDTQEATYIWQAGNVVKELGHLLKQTERMINIIIEEGKNEYIGRAEKNFSRVFHDYTDLQNGFKIWKQGVEKIIS